MKSKSSLSRGAAEFALHMDGASSVYGLKYGAVVTLIKVHPCRFVFQMRDRYGE
jgi:hypothetical protein